MRGNNDGFMLNFLVVLILLNAVFLVVAQTGGAGKTTTEPDNPGYTHPSSTPIVSLAGDSSPTDSTPMMPSTSVLISSTTTGTAPRSSSLKRGRLSPGATAGIVVATVIPFILAVGIYLLYLLKRQRRPPRHGPVDLTVEPDPIGSPVYEKSFVPTPFLTDTEANELGYGQSTRRVGAKFTTVNRLGSAPQQTHLTDSPTSHTHTTLPVLLSHSGHSLEPPVDSRSTLATQRPNTASSEDTLTEEPPPKGATSPV